VTLSIIFVVYSRTFLATSFAGYSLNLPSVFSFTLLSYVRTASNIPYSCRNENNASKEWKTPSGGKERGSILVAIRATARSKIRRQRGPNYQSQRVPYKITSTRWYGSPPSFICRMGFRIRDLGWGSHITTSTVMFN
jgi:hypothetical protein